METASITEVATVAWAHFVVASIIEAIARGCHQMATEA